MLIAVTGATGFLGRYIVRRLAAAGHTLRCWHRPTSLRGAFDDVNHAITWLPGQLGDEAATNALVQGVDAVVHAAVDWAGARQRHREQVGPHIHENLVGSLQLFEAARAAQIPRFVHISTCAVHDVILGDRPLDETHPLWPKSHYGAHKAALENFIHSYGLGHGWPICALRPTGIYGLDYPAEKSRWYALVRDVVHGAAIDSASGGKEVHVADVARAVELLLHADVNRIAGQAYNCYDLYVAEETVARLAKEFSGSKSVIATLNKGPKNQIVTEKLRGLGMTFGGETLLRQTVAELVAAVRAE